MSFEIYYTERVVDLKAISRVLLLQSSNLWASATIVVGKSIFPPLINTHLGFTFIPPTNLACPISSTASPGFYRFCSHSSGPVIQRNRGLKWKESANEADVD